MGNEEEGKGESVMTGDGVGSTDTSSSTCPLLWHWTSM